MILPKRPLTVARAYHVEVIRRALALLVGILLAGLLTQWAVWGTLRHFLAELSAGSAGHEIELLDVSIGDSRVPLGPVHTFYLYLTTREDGVERVEHAGPFFVLGGAPPDPVDVRAVRDERSGLVCTSFEAALLSDRILTASILTLLFVGALVILVVSLARRLVEYVTVLRTARSGDEVLFDVSRESSRDIEYRVSDRLDDRGGYRASARGAGVLARFRQPTDEARPLVLRSRDGARLLGLRLATSRRVVLVRQDFWPFALDDRERRAALAALAEAEG